MALRGRWWSGPSPSCELTRGDAVAAPPGARTAEAAHPGPDLHAWRSPSPCCWRRGRLPGPLRAPRLRRHAAPHRPGPGRVAARPTPSGPRS
ncbi:MAG: hypothetical protein MZW92_15615 [Comamonadaceae bacterium]|nr:hypothetical protein [Comamonadaceae bacterium]